MSVRSASFLVVIAVAASAAIGCASVPADKYARDMQALRDYNETLERQNQALLSQVEATSRQLGDVTIARTTDELYDQLARQLGKALEGFKNGDGSGMTYNPRTGAWEMGTDLLFESGSATVSAQGKEILKKFADAHKNKSYSFRIVGHTDRAPIVKKKTTDMLATDTNMELSALRAIAVMGTLKSCGIAESSFAECIGKGNREPAASNDKSAQNMRKNRRVEIFVLGTPNLTKTSAAPRDTTTK
jgi:flagellar motor protein MotB